ncbi:hypothetical protein [Prosthecobacter sp.]|uniref:hypothetical protein n=1 Tax=Prosthecobacter sp. TaxID=1965333 RepID=UPI00378468C6
MRCSLLREVIALLLFVGISLQTAIAAAPGWWTTRNVLRSSSFTDDYALANLGQLKTIARKAADEMNSTLLPIGADTTITNMIAQWTTPPNGVIRDDFAVLTLGQLKTVARPFYDRLAAVGSILPNTYPWTGINADDYALVNIGQLKTVFAFDLSATAIHKAFNAWAQQYFGSTSVDIDDDSDFDGLTNLEEMQASTDPTRRDTDGDGWNDQIEVSFGSSPTDGTSLPTAAAAAHHHTYDTDSYAASDTWSLTENTGAPNPNNRWYSVHEWFDASGSGSVSKFSSASPFTALKSYPSGVQGSDQHWQQEGRATWIVDAYDAQLGPEEVVPNGSWFPIINRWDKTTGNTEKVGWSANWKRYRVRLPAPLSTAYEETYLKITYQWDTAHAVWTPYDIWDIFSDGYWTYPDPTVKSVESVKMTVSKGQTLGDWLYVMPSTSDNELLSVHLQPVKILPDESMYDPVLAMGLAPSLFLSMAVSGTAVSNNPIRGDLIASQQGTQHFVTPKKTDEIYWDYVTLRAEGVTDADYDQNGKLKLEWHGVNPDDPLDTNFLVPIPGDPLRINVRRDKPRHAVVSIGPKGGNPAADQIKMHVWVVWTEITPQYFSANQALAKVDRTISGRNLSERGSWFRYGSVNILNPLGIIERLNGVTFRFQILPPSIIGNVQNADIPNLTGPADDKKPNNRVPGYNKPSPTNQASQSVKADSARDKWDVSRQMQITIKNPQGILKNELAIEWPPKFCEKQPDTKPSKVFSDVTPVPFPSGKLSDVEGNDDPPLSTANDEDDNPYVERNIPYDWLNHPVGCLSSVDSPSQGGLEKWGKKEGDKLGIDLDFIEFARVQLWDNMRTSGRVWFRISDPTKGRWHHRTHFQFNILNRWEDDTTNGSDSSF